MTARGESDSLLEWLQEWYARQCDGDWEHQYGVTIDTLDNPGWRVKIDITDTVLAGQSLERVRVDNSETDWLFYWVENDRFEAVGDPTKLSTILEIFRLWAESIGA